MEAMKPKVELSTTKKSLPSTVTPIHIRDAAELMKTDNRPVKDYQRMAPQDLARAGSLLVCFRSVVSIVSRNARTLNVCAVATTHGDASYLGDLLDKYGGQVTQPALRSQLAADRAQLDDAKEVVCRTFACIRRVAMLIALVAQALVQATDAQIAAPDDPRRKQVRRLSAMSCTLPTVTSH